MLIILFLLVAYSTLLVEYESNLIIIVQEFNNNLTELNIKDSILSLLGSRIGYALIAVLALATIATFCGIRFEKYFVSLMLGVFINTAVVHYIKPVNKFIETVISSITRCGASCDSEDAARYTGYVIWAGIILLVIIFLALYRILRLLFIVLAMYVVLDWAIESHIKVPATLDLLTKVLLAVCAIAMYIYISYMFSTILALIFAIYGSLFVTCFLSHIFLDNNDFDKFLSKFFEKNTLISIKSDPETFNWLSTALIGFILQVMVFK